MEYRGDLWRLRLPALSDTESFYQLYSDPVVQEQNGGILERQATQQLLEMVVARNNAGDGLEFVLESPPFSPVAGLIGFSRLSRNGEGSEFGACAARRLWGTGIVRAACAALLNDPAIRTMAGPIEGFTHSQNLRALRFAAKLGFEKDRVQSDGVWVRLLLRKET